jgi:hypothetical protein
MNETGKFTLSNSRCCDGEEVSEVDLNLWASFLFSKKNN